MKSDQLETLLLDRALGELSPEVAALLDSHLVHNPAAAAQAGALAETLAVARTATTTAIESPRRVFDGDRLRREHRAIRAGARRREILRLAACLALGLGLGWLARTPPPARAVVAAVRPAPASALPPSSAGHPATRFWSLSRLAAEQKTAATRGESRYELRWDSAAKMPHLEEKP